MKTDFKICPKCGTGNFRITSETREGFSTNIAILGAFLLGPLGLVAGFWGKKKTTYSCDHCGFTVEKSQKDIVNPMFLMIAFFGCLGGLIGFVGAELYDSSLPNEVIIIIVALGFVVGIAIGGFIHSLLSTIKGSKSVQPYSSADEIAKLKNLLESGAITQEEFDIKKKQILNL